MPLTRKDIEDVLEPIKTDISKIKKGMFDPDKGLYARVERNTVWRKVHMYVYGSIAGGGIMAAVQHFI